jgi:hypothetical protein
MQPVFLICSPRSGRNLVTRLVDNHPQFCAPASTHLIRLLVQHRLAYGDLRANENWDDLCTDAADLLATKLGEWRTQPTAVELLDVAPRTLPALLRHIFEGEARACGKERLFIQEDHAARLLPFLLSTWPDAQFVYLVRDPRDMAASWKRSPVHRGDVVRAARVWQQDQADGITAIAQLQDAHRLHRLSHEDLVVVSELELLRLCRFLNARFSPAMLELRRPPTAVAESLDNAEIALVEAVCAKEMAFFGYEPASSDPRSLAELEAELLPFERHDKPGYRDLPTAERSLRARREMLVRRLQTRGQNLVPVA